MPWISILALTLIVVYFANVLGCRILCETIPEIESARKYAWYIPILVSLFIFFIAFDSSVENKLELIWGFIRMPHKNVMAVWAVSDALEGRGIKKPQYDPFHPKPSRQRQRVLVLANSVMNLGNAIVTTTLF